MFQTPAEGSGENFKNRKPASAKKRVLLYKFKIKIFRIDLTSHF